MNAEIITIGTEILLGQIDDTNATHISRELAARGMNLNFRSTVGDNEERIKAVFARAGERSDLVFVTGGLGPTFDDITLECAAKAFGVPLVENPDEIAHLEKFYSLLGLKFPETNRRQAMIPEGAVIILNPVGSAPGVVAEWNGTTFLFFPGVPRELKALLKLAFDELEKRGKLGGAIVYQTIRMFGTGESQLQSLLPDDIQKCPNPSIAFLAGKGEVSIRVTAKGKTKEEAEALLLPAADRIKSMFSEYAYGGEADSLESIVLELLKSKGLKLATAESCTGGMIGSRLTDIPGSSEAYLGGVIGYHVKVKKALLDVDLGTIEREGVVSEAVAGAMARGAAERTGADIAIGITGDAGPTTGEQKGTVGRVCLGIYWPSMQVEPWTFTREFGRRRGNRELIRNIMASWALDSLRRKLLETQS